LRLAGFSFGGVIGGSVATQLGDRLRSFTVVGSNGLGLERSPTPLRRVPPEADEAEEFATHRYNLNQLMIADPGKIDELALYLQKTNHAHARMRSRRFSRSGALIEALPKVRARLDGIWGERDATAYPHLDERAHILRGIQPAARFAIVPGAGHWVQHRTVRAGGIRSFGSQHVHDVINIFGEPAVSIHAYSPPLTAMQRYDLTGSGLARTATESAEEDW